MRILRILKVRKIHEFLRILKNVSFKIHKIQIITAAQFQQTLCHKHSSYNFWIKNSVMSRLQDSLTCQQFSMIMSSLLQSLQIACSFTVFPSVRIRVVNYPLFPFNGCLTVIDYSVARIRKLCSYC